jgi:hypothetical protein
MFNEGNQIHNFMSSSSSGTVINYGSGSGSDFLTSCGSGSTSQKVTVPTVPVPVPVPQHCLLLFEIVILIKKGAILLVSLPYCWLLLPSFLLLQCFCCCKVTSAVGYPAFVGYTAVAVFPSLAGLTQSNILKYYTIGLRLLNWYFFCCRTIQYRL